MPVPVDGAGPGGLACSADSLCDIWHEWGGLQEQVVAHRAQQHKHDQEESSGGDGAARLQ